MSDFNSDIKQFTERTIMFCDQCERECMFVYFIFLLCVLKIKISCSDVFHFFIIGIVHVGCLRESGVSGLTNCPTGDWLCSEKCSKVRQVKLLSLFLLDLL